MMAKKIQSALLMLVGFVSGSVLMYVVLLSRTHPLVMSMSGVIHDMVQNGHQVETLQHPLFTSHTGLIHDILACNILIVLLSNKLLKF